MNLIITNICNRSCVYCFAKIKTSNAMEFPKKNVFITLENYLFYLDFLKKSSIDTLKLLGGEPSLHPEFIKFIDIGLERGFNITIFTNGLWADKVKKKIKSMLNDNLNFVFNINEPIFQTKKEAISQKEALTIAGRHSRCSFNIFRTNFSILFLRKVIKDFSLKPSIRLGLACPIIGANNEYIDSSKLRTVGRRLVRQIIALEKEDIMCGFDCGFPLCMFNEQEHGILGLHSHGFASQCKPVIDVGTDLSVWPCYPMSNLLELNLKNFSNAHEITEIYRKKFNVIRIFGSMENCYHCKYLKREQCKGGCLSRGLILWQKDDPQILEKLEKN